MDTTRQAPTVVRNLSLEERAVSNLTYTYFYMLPSCYNFEARPGNGSQH